MTTKQADDVVRIRMSELRLDLGARAVGYWWLAGRWLEQVAFVASPALPPDVARGFAEATRSVSLAQEDLGIVKAALSNAVTVSRAEELAGDTGSGYWLRAFGASRSVAVPLHDLKGAVRAVLAVALADGSLDDAAVAKRTAATAREWAHFV